MHLAAIAMAWTIVMPEFESWGMQSPKQAGQVACTYDGDVYIFTPTLDIVRPGLCCTPPYSEHHIDVEDARTNFCRYNFKPTPCTYRHRRKCGGGATRVVMAQQCRSSLPR